MTPISLKITQKRKKKGEGARRIEKKTRDRLCFRTHTHTLKIEVVIHILLKGSC